MSQTTTGSPSTAAPNLIAPAETLRDFTTTWRVLPISGLALIIGVVSAYVAVVLLKLIGFFTNLFFYQRFSTQFISPAAHHLGYWVIVVPVIGGVIVGLMARYGSEKIRGHGMPEAVEAILIHGAKVQPRVAVLKPLSAAISIGSGGPFGAEGPIIMTGGAFGSLIAQFFHLTNAERKILLVAGAAAGMSAVFATPFAAVMLAVELLLFEWKPRSFIPVVFACVAAEAARLHLLGAGPIFTVPPHDVSYSPLIMLSCLLVGISAGVLAAVLSRFLYGAEDAFEHLRKIHWMWWPALGGLVIGVGGVIYPRALGVGYDVIADLLRGEVTLKLIVGVLLVKSVIWAISLGSGTSGGMVAPLLMIGGALGALGSLVLPSQGPGFWPLIGMGAVLAGALGTPLTGVLFAFELTSDYHSIFPLLIACMGAHAFTSITLRRSILTERLSRRGYHLSREYVVDPLESLSVEDVMRTNITALPAEATLVELRGALARNDNPRGQRIYPVIDANQRVLGVLTRHDIQDTVGKLRDGQHENVRLSDMLADPPVVAYPNEPLRQVVNRMVTTGLTRFPVVRQNNGQELVGLVGLQDLLKAREISVAEEHHRERVLRLRVPPSLRWRRRQRNKSGNQADGPEDLGETGTKDP
ncbi:MAG TPA: chloride channel protein [Candidatus Angelobacter sp.]|nr:chloride channel protein [Candidatus Angelobacter sp.]